MILIALYLGAIVLANLGIAHFGVIADIPISFLFIGLDLTTRDRLHDKSSGHLWRNMFLLIATGSIISALLNYQASQIALASFLAFGCAGVADTVIYQRLGEKSKLIRVNGSNVFSAGIDSVVFMGVAFGFPLLIPLMIGEWLAKVGGGFIWSLILRGGAE